MENPQKYWNKNLRFLKKHQPSLAYSLLYSDPRDVNFFYTEKNEVNLTRNYQNRQYFYHSMESPQQEATEWFHSLDLHTATVIFVYGIGLGYYYIAAKEWLEKHPKHALIFFEHDISIIYRLFETSVGEEILRNPQVQLVYFTNTTSKLSLNELSWTYFKCPFIISSLKLYQELDQEGYVKIQHQITHALIEKKVCVEEYLSYGIIFYRNFYPNMFEISRSYSANGLFDQFPEVPAIICGAGPSLGQHMAQLASLQDKALLFAGGSALNALIPKGIYPHFGVAIDPNKAQYSRVAIAQSHQIPFFYRNRLFHEAFKSISGPRLYVKGSGGYDTANWFEKELGIQGEDIEEGHNVINFSINIARMLGCNPIILVGVDLAFTGDQFYADGIMENLQLTQEDVEAKEDDFDAKPILREDIFGKSIFTMWKWIIEADWIDNFALENPDITFINATEGGLGFKNIRNSTFKEVIQQFLIEPKEAISYISTKINNLSFAHISSDCISLLFQQLHKSLNHCMLLLANLLQENDCLMKKIKKGETFPEDLQTTSILLVEEEIEKEVGYQYVLEIFSQIYIHAHYRLLQEIQSPYFRGKKKKALRKLEIQQQRLLFLKDTAQVQRDLIQRTLHFSTKHC